METQMASDRSNGDFAVDVNEASGAVSTLTGPAPSPYSDVILTGAEPATDVWSSGVADVHATILREARSLIAARDLAAPAGARATLVHLALEWSIAAAAAVVGVLVHNPVMWIVCWFVMAWVIAGNAALMHEAVHNHLFRSKTANKALGVVCMAIMFMPWSTYRAYHWAHHANTARKGDPEGNPLSLPSRFLYLPLLAVGGIVVYLEMTIYSLMTAVGHPPKWATARRHRRAIKWNGLLVLGVVALAVFAYHLSPALTLEIWFVPVAVATCSLVTVLLLPEHYGGTGTGDILSSTRSVKSNRLLRWFFWNTNYHAAHHLAPAVPFTKIELVDDIIEEHLGDPQWRVRSYSAFHFANLWRLAYNKKS
jgi:fatty acid desaturase